MDKEEVRDVMLEAMEASLEAQLRAVRRLRSGPEQERQPSVKSISQVDMVYDILKKARRPLHVSEIIERVEKQHGVGLDRESIVSALTKKVARGDRFIRSDKNTFSLKGEE